MSDEGQNKQFVEDFQSNMKILQNELDQLKEKVARVQHQKQKVRLLHLQSDD